MFNSTTLTGLLPVATKINRKQKKDARPKLDFQICIQPINYVLKPLTGIYKPFRYGCSILCNHPGDTEVKDIIKRTKFKKIQDKDDEKEMAERLGQCLEEMLERYGAKKSGDISTPNRTLESSMGSSFEAPRGRRCFTPQPKPKQFLVLDLRRTVSQETLSTNLGERIQSSNMSPSGSSIYGTTRPSTCTVRQHKVISPQHTTEVYTKDQSEPVIDHTEDEEEEEEDIPRRRGRQRKRKKKLIGRSTAEGGKEVMGIVEPGETQVSAYVDGGTSSGQGTPERGMTPLNESPAKKYNLNLSLFDEETLRHIRRYVSSEDADGENRGVWRRVLTEALKACEISPEEELKHVKEQINIQPCNPENWLSLPRTFSLEDARFSLPLDRNMLNNNFVSTGEVMGKKLSAEQATCLKESIDWYDIDTIDLRTWFGICAFAERLLGHQFTSQPEPDLGSRPSIEILDFDLLPKWLTTTKPNQSLLSLLNVIASSDKLGESRTNTTFKNSA